MKIYVMRHGLTDMNIKGFYNGLIDEDINEIGIQNAKDAIKELKKIKYDLIYSSPLKRAKHTCEIINISQKEVIYDDRLKERSLGKLDGKDIKALGLFDKCLFDYNFKIDDKQFESLPFFFKKVHIFIDEIITKHKDKNILIVAHGAILRAIYFYFNEIPRDGNLNVFKIPGNCEINTYEVK